MIHNTFLVRESTSEVLASTRYWPVEVEEADLKEFVATRAELRKTDTSLQEIPLIIGDNKFHGWSCGDDLLLVFVTDTREDEHGIFERMEKASETIRKKIKKDGLEETIKEYESLIEPSVITRLKIALVGEGGVGKTTTLHLLLGDKPPTQYVPTIALNLETVENIRFGNYSLVLWDFAGQERFRNLWRFYFHGADVIFLVCDSTLRNVLISKDILKLIRRDAPKVPVFALANKQDLPNAMKPEVVQKILGIPTYPMVAIDKERRDEMLRILMNAAAQYVGVALPDLPTSELLRFSDEAARKAAEIESLRVKPRREEEPAEEEEEEIDEDFEIDDLETIEIVEEVLIDEDGHIVEEPGEYEIVEEIIEEVEAEDETEEEAPAGEEIVGIVDESPVKAVADIIEVVDEADSETSAEIAEPPTVAASTANGSREMAKAIISDRLDADDVIIEEELDTMADESLDSALKALDSDEVGEATMDAPPPTVREEELADLDKILGFLDDKPQKPQEEEDDASPHSVDRQAIDDLERAISSGSDDHDEEE
ncbi:MAG: ADP-ribosylation factor-like protein [Candidatus Thorarchaeota archaeon]